MILLIHWHRWWKADLFDWVLLLQYQTLKFVNKELAIVTIQWRNLSFNKVFWTRKETSNFWTERKVISYFFCRNKHLFVCIGQHFLAFYILHWGINQSNIGTPYLLTILVFKICNSPFYYLLMCLKYCCMHGKLCRPWSDAAFCSIWSGSTLFAKAFLSQY